MSTAAMATPRAFTVWFRDLHRWSAGSFVESGWRWPAEYIRPLSDALSRKSIDVNGGKTPAHAVRLVTLHFDGEMKLRAQSANESFKGRLFFADPGYRVAANRRGSAGDSSFP